MAPTPQNNTARYWVDYAVNGQQHSLLFRPSAGATKSTFVNSIVDFISEAANICKVTTDFNALRYSEAGSNFSLPETWAPVQGTVAGSTGGVDAPNFVAFSGRGLATGTRVKWSLFGTIVVPDDSYRMEPNLTAGMQAVYDALLAFGPALVTVQGDPVSFKPYVNLGRNAYFQRKQRTG